MVHVLLFSRQPSGAMAAAKPLSLSTTAWLQAVIERRGSVAPMTLYIHCPHCGGALTLQTDTWVPTTASKLIHEDLEPQSWLCPHCAASSTVRIEAPLLWATAGHHAEDVV
jgi:hypothetical protein